MSDSRTYYDGAALNSVGTLGDATRTEDATDTVSGALHFAVTTSTYDPTGRLLTSTAYSGDPNIANRTTSSATPRPPAVR